MNDDVKNVKTLREQMTNQEIELCDLIIIEFTESINDEVDIEALEAASLQKIENKDFGDSALEYLKGGLADILILLGVQVPAAEGTHNF